jgi:pectinesterase
MVQRFVVVVAFLVLPCYAAYGLGQTYYYDVPATYSTIPAAITAVPDNALDAYVIRIAPGTYFGTTTIPSTKQFVTLKGTGALRTDVVLTWNSATGRTLETHATSFRVENLTIENTAGATAGQALALYADGDKQVYENVLFKGWQDTVAVWQNRQYFHNCEVWGSVDFIYSGSTGVFDNCRIVQIRSTGGVNAAPSTPANVPYGLVFMNCRIAKTSGVAANSSTLMRPWYPDGATAYLNCVMEDHITPAGWAAWGGRENTCRAAEYNSTRPDGSVIDLSTRSYWVKRLTVAEAAQYTLDNIFSGWDPMGPMLPSIWQVAAGNWETSANWLYGVPSTGRDCYVQGTGAVVTVRNPGATAATLTMDGTSKVYVDGATGGSLTIGSLVMRTTTPELHIANYGQFSTQSWNGPWGPAGLLYVDKGSFSGPYVNNLKFMLAAPSDGNAVVTISSGNTWGMHSMCTGAGKALINMTGGSVVATWGLCFGDIASGGNVTFNFSGGTINSINMPMSSKSGTYTVSHSGGKLTINSPPWDGWLSLGSASGSTTTYTLSEDSAAATIETKGIRIADSGTGTLLQKAGTVLVETANTGANSTGAGIEIARNSSGIGTYEIQGGTLAVYMGTTNAGTIAAGGMINGANASGKGTFKVTGGTATITIYGGYTQGAASTLAAENRGGAISTITVNGNVVFNSGAKLKPTTAWGVPAGDYVLMTWTGTRTGNLTLDASINASEWSFAFDDTAKTLTLHYTPVKFVNFIDLATMASRWMSTGCTIVNSWCWGADIDKSGTVDALDMSQVFDKWLLGR